MENEAKMRTYSKHSRRRASLFKYIEDAENGIIEIDAKNIESKHCTQLNFRRTFARSNTANDDDDAYNVKVSLIVEVP